MKKIVKIFKKLFLGILLFLLVYILGAFLLSKITINSAADNQSKEVTIYIKTNGVHTDLVLPVKNDLKDWSS